MFSARPAGFGPTDPEPTRGSDDLNWIAYADLVISEIFAAAWRIGDDDADEH